MLPLKDYIKHPVTLLISLLSHFGSFIPDKPYLQLLYRLRMGYWPNLKNPKTFNEKLQWLKLYDRRPEYTQMVDKVEAKKYVANIIGEEYIIPTLGVWDCPDDIDWDRLPRQFVLKTTHGSGGNGVVICKDKNTFDKEKTIIKLKKSIKKDVYKTLREWPYKNLSKRVIAEQYMTNEGKDIEDYKIHNFNGQPTIILLCRDRYKEKGLTEDFYSVDWEHLDMKRPNHDNPGGHERPRELQQMLSLAKKLSEGIPFLRTDFYIVQHKVYFGELTFYPAGGMRKFEPESCDCLLGNNLSIL